MKHFRYLENPHRSDSVVSVSSPPSASGQVPTWNGSEWVPQAGGVSDGHVELHKFSLPDEYDFPAPPDGAAPGQLYPASAGILMTVPAEADFRVVVVADVYIPTATDWSGNSLDNAGVRTGVAVLPTPHGSGTPLALYANFQATLAMGGEAVPGDWPTDSWGRTVGDNMAWLFAAVATDLGVGVMCYAPDPNVNVQGGKMRNVDVYVSLLAHV